jgi:glutamyl-tRNA synthetase
MGALRAAGATPDQVVGYCAWLLGIRAEGTSDRPVPLSCAQACRLFSWKDVAASLDDRMLPKDVVEVIRHL